MIRFHWQAFTLLFALSFGAPHGVFATEKAPSENSDARSTSNWRDTLFGSKLDATSRPAPPAYDVQLCPLPPSYEETVNSFASEEEVKEEFKDEEEAREDVPVSVTIPAKSAALFNSRGIFVALLQPNVHCLSNATDLPEAICLIPQSGGTLLVLNNHVISMKLIPIPKNQLLRIEDHPNK